MLASPTLCAQILRIPLDSEMHFKISSLDKELGSESLVFLFLKSYILIEKVIFLLFFSLKIFQCINQAI